MPLVDTSGPVKPIDHLSRGRKVLCLSGGGYRGVFSARILEHFEQEAGRPVRECFDLIVGTSTGALIGAALALGIPAGEIGRLYREEAPRIFRAPEQKLGAVARLFRRIGQAIVGPPYDIADLREAVRNILGADIANRELAELDLNFACVSVSYMHGRLKVFGAGKFAAAQQSGSVCDALACSAAAPTFFSSVNIGGEAFIDGGVAANSPELVGFMLMRRRLNVALNDLRVLSVGTCGPSWGLPAMGEVNRSAAGWVLSARGLVQVAMAVQQSFPSEFATAFLGSSYARIDFAPAADQATAIGDLSNVTEMATQTLVNLGDSAWASFVASGQLAQFTGALLVEDI